MQEQQATVEGVTYPLPRPFLVVATQNPIEYEGTFPLPEAQLDRFLMKLNVGYPSPTDEKLLLNRLSHEHPINQIKPVVESGKLIEFQRQVWEIFVEDSLQEYIIQLVTATRNHRDLILGASPRASLALFKASQAFAAVQGRDHVIPDDIQKLIHVILGHRLILSPEAQLRGRTTPVILEDILKSVPLNIDNLTPEKN
jgi:MoxR-like ATPase